MVHNYTAIIHQEGNLYVSECLELEIASQGDSASKALENLTEAVQLFLEVASDQEIQRRLESKTVTPLEVSIG
ncbi:MAG: type II toxin-antitoxin system HicB family antitoxin [Acaryochloris sp. RU_4_1]|nr:type II toxin-antitoxin system HicB family antitoxin [Acaryochloris sp. SU_5_25]NJM64566.1 type II toxin-antitoxin system HicB family antitoxin [Acaryochloris sp. RU_4_1]NJN38989.1 type II toxin-antitoxin system HicB family antitoxin [Acaryochloridaceae cyanobacterium CSU_3_4]NJR54153.1 type II toxin-antitoxin system HicB family antitoxin [Acaryochloris sp. CRU_2_0]